MNTQTHKMLSRLQRAGISADDAVALRRISMTLHRWHELECGTDFNDSHSVCIVRGYKKNGAFEYDDNGKPYHEIHRHSDSVARYFTIPDRETGAKKRLAAIMARYPGLTAYIQTDPRGAALYILRAGDVPEGVNPDSCYSNGIAVCK